MTQKYRVKPDVTPIDKKYIAAGFLTVHDYWFTDSANSLFGRREEMQELLKRYCEADGVSAELMLVTPDRIYVVAKFNEFLQNCFVESSDSEHRLEWFERSIHGDQWREAILQNPDGSPGVRFSLVHYRTCHRRGPWRLLIEVAGGPFHDRWGCFDEQDQPMRWYHNETCALQEAQSIATVLLKGFERDSPKDL